MLYLTHSLYAVGISLLFGPLIYLCGFSHVNYWLMLIILAVFGKEGGKWPDCDHSSWNSVKEKTPFYWVCNKIIRMTGGKHRSRHTHALSTCVLFLCAGVVVPVVLANAGMLSFLDSQLIMVCASGFGAGWLSHLLADALNTTGIWATPFSKKQFSLVGKGTIVKFNTGGNWEDFCQFVVGKVNILCIVAVVAFGVFYVG